MTEDKYTVTFRMARMWDSYNNPDKNKVEKSDAGHLWYVLRENGALMRRAGFHSNSFYDIINFIHIYVFSKGDKLCLNG